MTVPDRAAAPSKQGASEIHLGRMADGHGLLATLEPWHGNRVTVYSADVIDWPLTGPTFGPFSGRTVLDDTLADGHALWVADIDRDGDDEVFAGHRGKDHRVSMYDFDRARRHGSARSSIATSPRRTCAAATWTATVRPTSSPSAEPLIMSSGTGCGKLSGNLEESKKLPREGWLPQNAAATLFY